MAKREGIEKVLTFQALEKTLHVSRETLLKWRDAGMSVFYLGRRPAVHEDDLIAFLRGRGLVEQEAETSQQDDGE